MTKLSPVQLLDVSLVSSADERWRGGKRVLELDIRRELTERSQYLLDARNDAVLAAHENGVPKVALAEGLHTKNVGAVRSAIESAQFRRSQRQSLIPRHFSRGDGEREVDIWLTGAELAEACAATDWSAVDAREAGVDTAVFKVVDPPNAADAVLTAVTPSFVQEAGKPHPVVSWGRAHGADVLKWWKEQAV